MAVVRKAEAVAMVERVAARVGATEEVGRVAVEAGVAPRVGRVGGEGVQVAGGAVAGCRVAPVG